MTLNEFKAWLEGYEASFDEVDGKPTPGGQQWAAIKARLSKVTPEPSASKTVYPTKIRGNPTWPEPLVTWSENRIADAANEAIARIDRAAFNEAAEV